ncbi:MAG: sensor histidine kinase [Solirubrobacteraceae bacterium]
MSALLTFAILCAFAVVVGFLMAHRMRADFKRAVAQSAEQVVTNMVVYVNPATGTYQGTRPSLPALAGPSGAVLKLFTQGGTPFAWWPRTAPPLGGVPSLPAFLTPRAGVELETTVNGYLVETLTADVVDPVTSSPFERIFVQYARPLSAVNAEVARLDLFLLLGVLAGSGFALLAGTMIARRAMAPIGQLTSTAAKIARTRDPSMKMPEVSADDEVGELARTLGGMLHSLEAAHAETEQMLVRQRQFVADASHELRTPLTSVLANLDLLAETLRGEHREAARSALHSSKRMSRLVADLLLLARSDVGRVVARRPTDLAQVAIDAAAELGPMSVTHQVSLDVKPAVVEGSRDELDRVAINLMENALRHTPPGSEIWVSTGIEADGQATLVVEDNGPGVPDHLTSTLFERFVRGAGDGGGSFGLGLAIVRAVAQSHGGTVEVGRTTRAGTDGGARFVIRLPAAPRGEGGEPDPSPPGEQSRSGAREAPDGPGGPPQDSPNGASVASVKPGGAPRARGVPGPAGEAGGAKTA